MNNKEILILALVFIGTMLIRLIIWKDFESGFFLGIVNMNLAGFIMLKVTKGKDLIF
ncbi:MAG TPA: hypothetical protein VMZ91_16385 [Candidatus Paceibacterota bacterium]|nr:hypothetical protein [Candidatus Paceibacterota bacterium]